MLQEHRRRCIPLKRIAGRCDFDHCFWCASLYLCVVCYIVVFVCAASKASYCPNTPERCRQACSKITPRKCTRKGIWRQGIVLKHRDSLQKSLCSVVICPSLCSSEHHAARIPAARCGFRQGRRGWVLARFGDFGRHSLPNAACLLRPHLLFLCVAYSVKDDHNLLH